MSGVRVALTALGTASVTACAIYFGAAALTQDPHWRVGQEVRAPTPQEGGGVQQKGGAPISGCWAVEVKGQSVSIQGPITCVAPADSASRLFPAVRPPKSPSELLVLNAPQHQALWVWLEGGPEGGTLLTIRAPSEAVSVTAERWRAMPVWRAPPRRYIEGVLVEERPILRARQGGAQPPPIRRDIEGGASVAVRPKPRLEHYDDDRKIVTVDLTSAPRAPAVVPEALELE